MLFACNIDNADLTFGVFHDDILVWDARASAGREKSADEYAVLFSSLFAMHQMSPASIDGAIVSSVVRPLSATICGAVERLMHVKPLLVGPGVKSGLNIKTDIPSQVGADIVANAVAAISLADSPLVVLDFGTATTLAGINDKEELCGVLICPGVRSSLDALSASAAELPGIALEAPRSLLGKNTIDSMISGIIHGHAAMIDGLLDRIAESWDTVNLTAIATGDLAEKIIPYCRSSYKIQYQPSLVLLGLRKIDHLNSRHKS